MSDYPFKIGDLVNIKYSHTKDRKSGVIVGINKDVEEFQILVEGLIENVHRNYIVVPKVQTIKVVGGLK